MKRGILHRGLLLLLAGCLLLMNGCKTSQPTGPGKANTKALDEFVMSMQSHELPLRTFSARLNVNLKLGEKRMSSRVEMKLVKDSALQLSIQPLLGIEVFRLELSTDSVKILDRMNRQYLVEGYSQLKELLPIDFNYYNLQALFLNRLFLPGKQEVDDQLYHRFKLDRNEAVTHLHTQDRMQLHYRFEVDNEERLLSTTISNEQQYQLSWNYANFQPVREAYLFPQQMEVTLLKQQVPQGGLDISYSRIQPDKSIRLEFQIPAKYKRVTFGDIQKIFIHTYKQ